MHHARIDSRAQNYVKTQNERRGPQDSVIFKNCCAHSVLLLSTMGMRDPAVQLPSDARKTRVNAHREPARDYVY